MELMILFGIVGLLLITVGVVIRGSKKRDRLFIAGGALLAVYSIFNGDVIFIILQAVFIATAVYDLYKQRRDSVPQTAKQRILLWLMWTVFCLIVVLGLVGAYHISNSLEARLTSTIKQHVLEPDLFSENKIIEAEESYDFTLLADGDMRGIFQLSESEMERMKALDPLVVCLPEENCDINRYDDGHCNYVTVVGTGNYYRLCLDDTPNRVSWTVMWY